MIAALMGAVIVAGAVALFVAQQRSFQAGAGDRSMQEGARVALEEIAGNLRLAGYGIDRSIALDFGGVAAGWLENTPVTSPPTPGEPLGATAQFLAPADCAAPVTCRDRTDGSDELVVRFRNPFFGPHPLAAGSNAGQLVLVGGIANPMVAGQELLVICYGAEPREWAYVTVGADVAAADPAAPPATTIVPLLAGGRNFPQQNALLADPCFGRIATTPPLVFRVERLRYYVRNYADAGGAQRPYLVVERGRGLNGGSPEPVAPDVEDLQVAYLFPFLAGRTPGGALSPNRAERVMGGTPGTPLTSGAGSIDLAGPFPTLADARYLTSDPATGVLANFTPSNIRAVRLSLLVRSPVPDAPADTLTLPVVLNRTAQPVAAAARRYRRFLVETTVFLPNMTAVHSFAPYYRGAQSTAPGSLVGGG
jgi:hypothetical protein